MLARKQKETFMLHIVSSGIAEKTYGFFVTKKEMRLNMRDQSRSASRYVISLSVGTWYFIIFICSLVYK